MKTGQELDRHLDMATKATGHLKLSEEQIAVLENSFNTITKHPDGTTLMLIAAECGLTEEETQVSPAVIID